MQTLMARLPAPILAFLSPRVDGDNFEIPRVNRQGRRGLAIDGFDPVAYVADQRPRQGRPELSLVLGRARWFFASETNRQRFLYAPAKYTPAYGGHCAYRLASGDFAEIDAAIFSLMGGRLYLFQDEAARAAWGIDPWSQIARADALWSALARGAAAAA